MLTLLFLFMGIVFIILAADAWSKDRTATFILSSVYGIGCIVYFLSVVTTLPAP